jgi:hypothetical protein
LVEEGKLPNVEEHGRDEGIVEKVDRRGDGGNDLG